MTSTIGTNTSESQSRKLVDIKERAFAFAVRIVNLCKFLETNSTVSRSLIYQLLDAGTSVGANLEEAAAGQSKADLIRKNAIALKEARESNYWLRLIISTTKFKTCARTGILELIQESGEISKIIAKRIVSTKKVGVRKARFYLTTSITIYFYFLLLWNLS